MKTIMFSLFVILLCIYPNLSAAQKITEDTTLASNYIAKAIVFQKESKFDSAIICFNNASVLYEELEFWVKYLESKTEIGKCYQQKWQIQEAIKVIKPAIELALNHIDTSHMQIADSYNVLGQQYLYLSKFDAALMNLKKALIIKENVLGNNHNDVANVYSSIGIVLQNLNKPDSAMKYYEQSLKIKKELLGDDHIHIAMIYGNMGITQEDLGNYDQALQYYFLALPILKKHFGENHAYVAINYNNTGIVYSEIDEFDKALEYYFKSLKIKTKIFGKTHNDVAMTYNNIGNVYKDKSDYKNALDYYFKTILIFKEIFGENHAYVASCYNNIGIVYGNRGENDLALEYHLKALKIRKELLGDDHLDVATSYMNMGIIHLNTERYNLALNHFFKALQLKKELYGENNIKMASTYTNIGMVYLKKQVYDSSLIYNIKSLNISEEFYGPTHTLVAKNNLNIGSVYFYQREYEKALDYYNKSLEINKKILNEKHAFIARDYNNIAQVYKEKGKYNKAIQYAQKAIAANVYNHYDTLNINLPPKIENYLNWIPLLKSLKIKAEVYSLDLYEDQDLKIALQHYQTCDSLISRIRRSVATKSDKIRLGIEANEIYINAINTCHQLRINVPNKDKDYLKELAFYFSERNKSSVLLEALASTEAIKFAGIPDSLIEKEHNLKINIELYKKLLAEKSDSIAKYKIRDKLFNANRQYDQLISSFEQEFPSYFDLKYNYKTVTIKDIQNKLDKKTVILSYFVSDSLTTIFSVYKNSLEIHTIHIENIETKIKEFRYGLTLSNSRRFNNIYKDFAFDIYNLLIPENIPKNIKNMIIIPEGEISLIPFEALLTEKSISKEWKEQPYLIKNYAISYSYSANLLFKTFPKEKSKQIEQTDLNDWLAFAPVFNEYDNTGLTLRTRKILQDFDNNLTDSSGTRGMLYNGMYINPLPGTEKEVKQIFNFFNDNGKKALVQINKNANEEYIKTGELEKYKYIHFATHGFVNVNKPELSGLLLAQDTTLNEDGILYMGEIYNLHLNADLSVLSACETGLGEIKKGEGLIGLTRALLYAGSKNIIVSLWKVSDNSTSDLMIDFYKTLLETNQKEHTFSFALQKAKLNLIQKGHYAHPFYWSPFILIGQ